MFDIAPSSCWRVNESLAVEPRVVRSRLNWQRMNAKEGRECDGSFGSVRAGEGEGTAGEGPSRPCDALTDIAAGDEGEVVRAGWRAATQERCSQCRWINQRLMG